MTLESQIEAVLFYKNEPVEIKKLSELLDVTESDIKEALGSLSRSLESRGVCLIETEKEAGLATAPQMNALIERITKEEMSRDIGKAGLETLSIILYNAPISRKEIDYIRGVNSAFILRNLCMRGLIEKEPDPKDQRIFRYKSTISLLAHLGIKKTDELPEFDIFRRQMAAALEPELLAGAETK